MPREGHYRRNSDRRRPLAEAEYEQPGQLGRKRDHTRDGVILDAAIDVLADVGYVGMTMDMVAARAKAGKATLYRRWSTKSELVLDAVSRMQDRVTVLDLLPDTGTVRGDLLALFEPQSAGQGQRRLKIMAGLASMLAYDPAFTEVGDAAIIEPWAEASRAIINRGIARGEIGADVEIEMLSRLMPSMAVCRALIQRKTADWDFLVSLIDGVLMPALRNAPAPVQPRDIGN